MNKTEMRAYEELAEEILQEYTNCYSEVDKEVLAEMICNAGYRKQAEGEWISLEPEIGLFACSLCDHRILRAKCNFCPNCGAKMKGE